MDGSEAANDRVLSRELIALILNLPVELQTRIVHFAVMHTNDGAQVDINLHSVAYSARYLIAPFSGCAELRRAACKEFFHANTIEFSCETLKYLDCQWSHEMDLEPPLQWSSADGLKEILANAIHLQMDILVRGSEGYGRPLSLEGWTTLDHFVHDCIPIIKPAIPKARSIHLVFDFVSWYMDDHPECGEDITVAVPEILLGMKRAGLPVTWIEGPRSACNEYQQATDGSTTAEDATEYGMQMEADWYRGEAEEAWAWYESKYRRKYSVLVNERFSATQNTQINGEW